MRITWIISPDVSGGDWNMTDRKQQKIRNGGNTAWMKKQNRKQNRCAGWNPCHSHRDGSVVSFLAADMADTVSSDSNRVHKIYWNHRDQPCRMGQVWIYFVDMMILLSAFCNFYPYARSIVLGEDWPDTKTFYRKRAARILPSYYFMLAIDLFFYILPGHKYRNVGALCKDIVTHVFCVAPNWSDTYISTSFNGVLWTVQMEVIYYLLLPWIARLFRKWAFATYSVMLMISVTSTAVILNCFAGKERNYGNNILTFMGIYANGMLCCILYVMWKKYVTENKYSRLAGTVISVLCIFLMNGMIHKYDGDVNLQAVQLQSRLVQSFLFALFLFSTACAGEYYQKLYSNRVASLFCKFSYNLYLWHQMIAVWLKEKRIPYWSGDTPPNMTGDRVWQWKYQILIIVVSAAVAVAVTLIVEIPAARYLLKDRDSHKEEGKQHDRI